MAPSNPFWRAMIRRRVRRQYNVLTERGHAAPHYSAPPAPILPAADPDRRKRQEIYDDLQQRGFVIVRLS